MCDENIVRKCVISVHKYRFSIVSPFVYPFSLFVCQSAVQVTHMFSVTMLVYLVTFCSIVFCCHCHHSVHAEILRLTFWNRRAWEPGSCFKWSCFQIVQFQVLYLHICVTLNLTNVLLCTNSLWSLKCSCSFQNGKWCDAKTFVISKANCYITFTERGLRPLISVLILNRQPLGKK